MAMNATDLKSKADAVVTLGNALAALKANGATTLTAGIAAVQASRAAVIEYEAAVQEFAVQQSVEQVNNLET
jgi:hypothetical protein